MHYALKAIRFLTDLEDKKEKSIFLISVDINVSFLYFSIVISCIPAVCCDFTVIDTYTSKECI